MNEKANRMSGTHEVSGRFTDKEGNYRDGSLLKKKQEEWARDEEYSSPSFKAENEGGGISSSREHRRKDPHNFETEVASFDNEAKQEVDISRLRRKLESSINRLETALGHVNRGNTEALKKIEENHNQIRELQRQVEEEQHYRENILEHYLNMKKCTTVLQSKKEELVVAMDEAVRSGQQAGRDANQSVSRCDELTAEAHSLSAVEHEVDNELAEIHRHLDQTLNELRSSGERSNAAMAHAATLFEQIRHEQESAMQSDRMRKSLEAQLKEMQARLDEVEAAALKGDNKVIETFESRIREMENELDSEQRRYEDANKKISEHDRRVRELRCQIEEDKKDAKRAHDLIDKLQKKLKLQEKQIEEAMSYSYFMTF